MNIYICIFIIDVNYRRIIRLIFNKYVDNRVTWYK